MPIPTNFSTPIRQSAKNRAFSQLLEWIIDGTLQPNEKLHDADLAHALGVSRTPVREALQLLNAQGFVEMFPGVGTVVTAVNKEDITKILPPCGVLHGLAAELATPIITQEVIDDLREMNERFGQAIEKGDFNTALKVDEQFHNEIMKTAQNSYIKNMVSSLQSHVLRLYFHDQIILTTQSIDEHEGILKAFEEKDAETASRIMRINWVRPIGTYLETQKEFENAQ